MNQDRIDYIEQQKAIMNEHKAVQFHDRLVAALRDIVECRCAFSADRLEHALNAIEYCQETARALLAEIDAGKMKVYRDV